MNRTKQLIRVIEINTHRIIIGKLGRGRIRNENIRGKCKTDRCRKITNTQDAVK